MSRYTVLLTFLGLLVYTGCSNVEQGSGQVLENANSVISHGAKKVWIPENRGQAAVDEKDEEEPNS